jgi:hypothetical protein
MGEEPVPTPEMVRAARAHLASRYAKGAAELMWEEYHRPLPDLDAIRAVIDAARAPSPDRPATMDLGGPNPRNRENKTSVTRFLGGLTAPPHRSRFGRCGMSIVQVLTGLVQAGSKKIGGVIDFFGRGKFLGQQPFQ